MDIFGYGFQKKMKSYIGYQCVIPKKCQYLNISA